MEPIGYYTEKVQEVPILFNSEDEITFYYIPVFIPLQEIMLSTVEEKLNERLDRNEEETKMRYLLGNTELSPIVAKYLKKTTQPTF